MSNDRRAAPLPPWALRGLVVILIVGGTFYLWLCRVDPERWGQRGDALAPLAALLNAGALLALLHSLTLQREALRAQRRELRLQRLELKANREEMKAQREEFERTAEAQEALAVSQARLAEAQEQANQLSFEATLAQYVSTMSVLQASRVQIEVDRAVGHAGPGTSYRAVENQFEIRTKVDHLGDVMHSLTGEHARFRELRELFSAESDKARSKGKSDG
jgi:hypothetical protein